jgi:triosephosphate isomerase
VRAKAAAAIAAGMVPVVCVGEVEAERAAGRHEDVVVAQLRGSLADLAVAEGRPLVVAYEPVWAIGTGRTATADDAQAMSRGGPQVLHDRSAPSATTCACSTAAASSPATPPSCSPSPTSTAASSAAPA